MRKDRLSRRAAQKRWDEIRKAIQLNPWRGASITLPHIDMAAIFGDRKSITIREAETEISKILDEYL